jgi:hypothetical protein
MKLTAQARRALPASAFALPAERKYPEQDREHAHLAESYGKQEYDKGRLSLSQLARIRAKAKKVLGRSK